MLINKTIMFFTISGLSIRTNSMNGSSIKKPEKNVTLEIR